MKKHYTIWGDYIAVWINGGLTARYYINKSFDSIEWCKRKNMSPVESIITDNNKIFELWQNAKKTLACCIPTQKTR